MSKIARYSKNGVSVSPGVFVRKSNVPPSRFPTSNRLTMTITFPEHWKIPSNWRKFQTDAHWVYIIHDLNKKVEHVGVTRQVYQRLYNHLRKPIPNTGFGKFYNRKDIDWQLYPIPFRTRQEANDKEEELQIYYHLETDRRNVGKGKKNSTAKPLTARQQKNIVKMYQAGLTKAEISRKYGARFGTKPRTISKIINKHVK